MASGTRKSGVLSPFWRESFSSVDRWFAFLRLLVILGGVTWVFVAPLEPYARVRLLYNFLFFCIYTVILYIFIFKYPRHLRTLYLVALLLDLVFLYWLLRLTGGFHSDFYLGFFLLIALHSFYFGLRIGIEVMLLSSMVYIAAGRFDFSRITLVELGLRLVFFLLVAVSMGLLSLKERRDRARIERLNRELDRRKQELEREKQKLEQILLGIGAGLVMVDPSLRIVWMNQVAESWFGKNASLEGKSCGQVLWNEEQTCDNCPSLRTFQNGTIEKSEFVRATGEDEKRYYRITTAPIHDETGNVRYVLELIQDVTEEKTLQAQVVQASKLAAIGELASGVAHEINNPLSSISVCVEEMAELVRSDEADEQEILECIDNVRREIYRCKQITTGLLNFSRKEEPKRVPTDVNQVMKNVALLVRYRAELSRKQIRYEYGEDLPLILAHPDELAQVFLNILINALDFTPSGGQIEVKTALDGRSSLVVEVRDSGCGIAPRDLSRIFSPFFTTKPRGKGTGLGLSISKRIVERHGGTIEVESEKGKGTTVRIVLPTNGSRSPLNGTGIV